MRTGYGVGAVVLSMCLVGCVAEIDQTTYLQEATVVSPIHQPPLHLATQEGKNALTVSPYVSNTVRGSLSGYIPSHTKVNSDGVFQVDTLTDPFGGQYLRETPGANTYPFKGNNFSWSAEVPVVGVDLDLAWKWAAIGAGIRYGASDEGSLYGGTIGIGFFDVGSAMGFRAEGGIVWQMSHFRATSVVVTTERIYPFSGQSTSLGIYEDEETKTRLSWYVSAMLNTTFDFPIGAFIQGSFSEQSLFSYTPSAHLTTTPFLLFPAVDEETEVSATLTTLMLSPGLFVRLSDRLRLLAGVRIPYIGSGEISSGEQPLIPFVQVDFILPTGE